MAHGGSQLSSLWKFLPIQNHSVIDVSSSNGSLISTQNRKALKGNEMYYDDDDDND